MGDVGSQKGNIFFWQRSSSTNSGTTESRSGTTTSWRSRHRRGKSHKLAKREARPPRRDQPNGIIERAVGLVAGQARTLKAAQEHRIGTRVPPDARILFWLVEFVAYLMNR